MTITLHVGDIPADLDFGSSVAVDTETMGLNIKRDRLCLVQLSAGDGTAHLVQINKDQHEAPNLKKLMENRDIIKIFHFARFDVSKLWEDLIILTQPVYCTKIASKLARTFTDRHSLKVLARELAGVDMNKKQQSTYWGTDKLSEEQIKYAASDVLYLHKIKEELDKILVREERDFLAKSCFDFVPTQMFLDTHGWNDINIFEH